MQPGFHADVSFFVDRTVRLFLYFGHRAGVMLFMFLPCVVVLDPKAQTRFLKKSLSEHALVFVRPFVRRSKTLWIEVHLCFGGKPTPLGTGL